jgi:hypothetical protein
MRYCTGFSRRDGGEDGWHEQPKHFDVITLSVNDQNCEREAGEILLVFHVAVDSKQKIKLRGGPFQQFAVLMPAHPASATVFTS